MKHITAINRLLFLMVLLSAVHWKAAGQYEGNDKIRVAFANIDGLPDNFLRRIAAAGYNYVSVDFLPIIDDTSEWDNGRYRFFDDPSAPNTYYRRIRNAFLAVHDFNRQNGTKLQVMPTVILGSRFSNSLRYTGLENAIKWEPVRQMKIENWLTKQIHDNASGSALEDAPFLRLIFRIAVHILDLQLYSTVPDATLLANDEFGAFRCPSYAPDPIGYDLAIRSIFQVIASAFEAAKDMAMTTPQTTFPDSIACVNIGHDEPYLVDMALVERKHQFLVGQSQLDKEWIYNNCNQGNIFKFPFTRATEQDEYCYSLRIRAINDTLFHPDTTIDSITMDTVFRIDTMVVNRLETDTVSCEEGDEVVSVSYPYLDTSGYLVIDSADLRIPYNYAQTREDETRSSVGSIYYGEPLAFQIQNLMANAVARIVDTITNAADAENASARPLSNCKVIVMADAWDNWKKGGTFHVSGAVQRLAQLSPQCTSRVIFEPYQYDETHRDAGATSIYDWHCYQSGNNTGSHPHKYGFEGGIRYGLYGNYYNPDSVLAFFHSKGFKTMQTYAWADPSKYSNASPEKFANFSRMAEAAINTDRSKNIGYMSVNWQSGSPDWQGTDPDNLYAQNYRFVFFEYAAQLLNPSISHFTHTIAGQRNGTFFGNLLPVLNSPITRSFLVDQFSVRRMDYLVQVQNHFHPDLDDSLNITGSKGKVPFYDALLYCNNLSIKENLEPVYTISGMRRNTAKEVQPDVVVAAASEVRADLSRNGYRIPTLQEIQRAIIDTAVLVDDPTNEWIWHGTAADSSLCAGFYYYNHITNSEVLAPGQTGGVNKAFRVVTGIPDTVIITGYGDNLQKYAIARKVILMYDAFFDATDHGKYFAGENIIIREETDMPGGAEVLLKSE